MPEAQPVAVQKTPTGEYVMAKFHPSRFAYVRFYAAAIALVAIVMALQFIALPAIVRPYQQYFFALLAFAALSLIIAELRRMSDTYTITNMMIIERRGILHVSESFIQVDKISSSTIEQTVIDRLLDIGSIDIWSMGGSNEPEITIDKIPNARETKLVIDRLVQRR
jgi:uncharacterized membrane protein YdbT with pleckstrin-like domain